MFWGLLPLPEMARCGKNTGQHACEHAEQIDDRQQVSEGGHFMELLVS